MTDDPDQDPNPNPNEDPLLHAGQDAGFDDVDLGDTVDGLLADPTMWEEPADLADGIVAAIASESVSGPIGVPTTRRGTSWVRPALAGAAATFILLFVGIAVFSAVGGTTGSEEFSADLVPTGIVADASGTVEVRSFDSGLRIDLDAQGLPRRESGEFYEGWLLVDDGTLIPVGTFHDGRDVTLWAGIEPDRIVRFSITLESGVAPDSPEQGSSGDVVLRADLDG